MEIYLDNAATSFPKPPEVAKAVYEYMMHNGATAGRGAYERAMEADRMVYEARKLVAELFHFNDPKKVIFTANVTEALNLAMYGMLKQGDHVITSSLEHNAVWRCLKTLERDRGISISTIPATKEGFTNPDDIAKAIRHNTALIIFTHASNVLGTLQPIREIGAIARQHKIPFMVDAAQTAGVCPIHIEEDHIDLLAFTGHKSLLGPMGTGGLIVNWDGKIRPLKHGGTGGDSAYEYQPEYYPNKLETGTLNVSGIVGLREALRFIRNEGLENVLKKEKEIIAYALNRLSEVKDIIIYGPKDVEKIVGVISFNIKGISGEDIAYRLDQEYGIMIRVGLHCAPTAHCVIETEKEGTMRIGIGYFNEKSDIDSLVEALKKISGDY
ncbi:aminotransferase class V-fold PLP-dependent enzyme [Geosporobacter ferrireducens]|uniref:cysteine desulfurase n=1 Tax=Geosporobacter ferrireducens TaxID=1424294 RepID=A0A1D8GEB1_9FIRM|nr:aminotransferase class V-fold PLP-dependent enzyme [Geosporobacter ferrireducens]AOT69241.1 cysteine desulfurase [Geosporobacter ferrireducens]MTI56923.1 aminotransferase class V-fold PLP-dependent enzyme [Geosporobacter ferrireducens]